MTQSPAPRDAGGAARCIALLLSEFGLAAETALRRAESLFGIGAPDEAASDPIAQALADGPLRDPLLASRVMAIAIAELPPIRHELLYRRTAALFAMDPNTLASTHRWLDRVRPRAAQQPGVTPLEAADALALLDRYLPGSRASSRP